MPWLALGWLVALVVPAPSALAAGLLAGPVVAGALCSWLTIASWAGTTSHPRLAVAVGLLGAFLVIRRSAPAMRPAARPLDLAALGAGVASALLLLRPYIQTSSGSRLALLSRTADSATHLQMARAVARVGGYLMLLPDAELAGTRGAAGYPPGFSGVLGTLFPVPEHAAITEGVGAAIAVVCGLAGLVACLTVLVAGEALGQHIARAGSPAVVAGATVLLTVLGPTALLLEDGAFAQLLALVGVLTSVLLAQRSEPGTVLTVVPLALAAVLTVHAWYLVAPALLVPWLLYLAQRRPRAWALGLLVTALAPLGLYPVVSGPGGSQLSVVGFIDLPASRTAVAFLMTTVVALIVLVVRPAARTAQLPLLGALVVLLVFAVALGLGQLASTGSLSYYFFKLVVGVAVLAVPVLAIGGVLIGGNRSRPARAGVMLALAALAVTAAIDPVMRTAVRGSVPTQIAGGLQLSTTNIEPLASEHVVAFLDDVVRRHPQGVDLYHDTWLLGCDRAQSYVLAKWAYDLSLAWTPARAYLLDSVRFPSRDLHQDLLARVAQPDLAAMEVYYADRCRPAWLDELADDRKVTLVRLS